MRKMGVSLVVMVFLFSFGFQSAIADTEVSGNVTSDTTWTVAGSPYIVVGTVQVLEGVTLTIEPGVTVKFNDGLSLNIGGELIARGTATDGILFTSNDSTPAPGDWGSIKFVDSSVDVVLDTEGNYVSGCVLEYCRIEYGSDDPQQDEDGAIYCKFASPLIRSTKIQKCITFGGDDAIVRLRGSSDDILTFHFEDNDISENEGYGYILKGDRLDSLIIERNTIIANSDGIMIHGNYIFIKDSKIEENGAGISIRGDYVFLQGNNIRKNGEGSDGYGFHISGDSLFVIENTITETDHHRAGLRVEAYDYALVKNNMVGRHQGSGIFAWTDGGKVEILQNTIFNNLCEIPFGQCCGAGIWASCWVGYFFISDNFFSNNSAHLGGAIYYMGRSGGGTRDSIVIVNNVFIENQADFGRAIYLRDYFIARVNFNDFMDNSNEIYLELCGGEDIDATCNWWGTTDRDSIAARIWDYYDDMELGKVLYEPILTSPAIGEPDSVYSVVLKSDETYTSDLATDLWVRARMYIQLEGKDGGCANIDQTTVTITSSSTDTSGIKVTLSETDTTSGIFRGTALIDSVSVEGVSIGATVGETITITSDVDSTKFTPVLVGENPHPFISNLDIGGSEDIEHLVNHNPLITWSYADPQSLPQDGFQDQVGTNDDWSVAEMWDSGEVSSADTSVTYAGDSLIDGETYYLRARVKNTDDLWSSWANLSFRMNSLPTIPLALSPQDREVISDSIVTLIISNSIDAEGDNLTYAFEVYSDSLLSNLVTSATGVEEGIDSTIWLIDVPLEDNHQYWWRARAYDGFENGEWMASSSFISNSENDPPGSFHLLTPTDGSEVTTLKPILDWETSIDPDPGDVVTYTLFYGKDIPSQVQLEVGGESVYQIKTPLEDNQLYYWKVVAKDLAGAAVEDEEGYQTFITNTADEDPNSFNLVTPTQNSVEVDLTPIFYWENATDNDIADSIHYLLYVDQDSNFSQTTPTVVDSNCYIPAEELSDNSQYFWKVVAVDKESLTTSTDTWRFFTNVALEPPNPFSLIGPELGIDSVSTTPTFLWHKATDNDLWDYTTYKLYLSPDSTFSQEVRVIHPADTHFTVPPGIPLNDNTRYYWKVVAMDTDSLTTWGSNSDVSPWWFVVGKEGVGERGVFGIPQAFALSQNFPNPFNPTTEIRYALPRDAQIRLEIYNLLGQKVAILADGYQRAGYRSVRWDARDLASGVYLYRLEAGKFTAVKKLVVIK